MMHRRPLLVLVLLAGMALATQSAADARRVRGVTCPTGTAQVVLDPGHGGADTGAVNATYNLVEKNLTLDIANRTAAMLTSSGYSVALTRYDDRDLGNSERGETANACGALVFVEIHLNGTSNPATNYTQTFWGKPRKDLDFSTTMSGAMNALGIPNNGVAQFANGGLLTASMPSTLVETVFITSDAEGQLLSSSASGRLEQIAGAITNGVLAYVG